MVIVCTVATFQASSSACSIACYCGRARSPSDLMMHHVLYAVTAVRRASAATRQTTYNINFLQKQQPLHDGSAAICMDSFIMEEVNSFADCTSQLLLLFACGFIPHSCWVQV